MQNQIAIFNFENHQVRTAIKNGNEPYFCLADVTEILAIKNTSDVANKQLDPKGIAKIQITDSLNRKQTATFISEPNLYRVIFRSNKPEAVKFQNWVFDDVLPSIRKTGSYRHTISVEQQATIRQAVARRCQSNRTHYQSIYTALHTKFGIPRYDELLACNFDDALTFIEQYQLADNMPNNAFWRMVGILEYERLSREIDALEKTLDSASAHLNHIKRTKGLLYDAFGEQRHISHNPELIAKARAFIDRQMAMKRRIGFI